MRFTTAPSKILLMESARVHRQVSPDERRRMIGGLMTLTGVLIELGLAYSANPALATLGLILTGLGLALSGK